MHHAVLFALVTVLVLAHAQPQQYSYSQAVGPGSGSSYVISGAGRITGIRVWEAYNNFIYGFQLRYGFVWSKRAGRSYGLVREMKLFDNEAIVQISGKYARYVQWLMFITSRGRVLSAGQPSGHSFNMYPIHPDGELRFLSGRYSGAITSIGAHWAIVNPSDNSTAH